MSLIYGYFVVFVCGDTQKIKRENDEGFLGVYGFWL
jgi:hypothetical protein